MRTRIPLLWAFITISMNSAFAAEIQLMVGEQKTIPKVRGNGQTITVTNSKALKTQWSPSGLKLIAKAPGLAHISTGSRLWDVTIYSTKLRDLRSKVENTFKNSHGLHWVLHPTFFEVTGLAYRLQDWVGLQELRKTSKGLVQSTAGLSPELAQIIEEKIRRNLEDRSLLSARTQVNGGQIIVMNTSDSKKDSSAVKEIADEWGAKIGQQTLDLELRPMVEVEIVIAELKKNAMRRFGLKLPGHYSATLIPTTDLSSAQSNFGDLTATFDAELENQLGRIIATPKLLCRSGEAAHFLAGGEIPVKITSWKVNEVQWKRYGVILDITPKADLHDGISTKIVTEVSLLDDAHKVDGIPGLLTNRIETHFDLRGTQTIALSGLLKSEIGRGTQGTPLLSEIPIVGEIFKSRDYKNNQTELVVFVTPRVISPENPQQNKSKPDWLRTFEGD